MIRVPAGVRVAGRSYGGRFVSVGQLRRLASATTDAGRAVLLDYATRELDKSARAVARLSRKFDDDPKRYAGRLHDADTVLADWQGTADRIVERFTEARVHRPRAPIAPPPAPPPTPPEVPPETFDVPEDVEDYADEWEVGVEYLAASGAQSNIDINIRLRRADGMLMGKREARDTMARLIENFDRGHDDPVPSGYWVAGVDWRRPVKGSRGWYPGPGWRSGDASDLSAFKDVLYLAAGDATRHRAKWRFGDVEND